jgi:predicted acetyltransferase
VNPASTADSTADSTAGSGAFEAGPVPRLDLPTTAVRDSFLAGERAICEEDGTPAGWLVEAAADFGALVASRSRPRRRWGVPVTELWYIREPDYIGTVMIRHDLTPALYQDGGNVGYHVVPRYRRQGHATAMLAAACARCRTGDMTRLLVTCRTDNIASRRVIEANAGVLDSQAGGICRFWITL